MTEAAVVESALARHAVVHRKKPVVPDAVLGTLLFVGSEIMFFLGIVSVFLVLRAKEPTWPPLGQPRLPVEVTGLNTLVLLFSAVTMWRTRSALLAGQRGLFLQWLGATLVLGMTFLAIQGYEWVKLIGYGLTTNSSVYGGIFYATIGAHGVHVLGGLIALAMVFRKALRGDYTPEQHDGLLGMRVFWFFVVGIWPGLYVLLYVW